MKQTIAIIGAGRVGRALGRALRERGWRIGAVVTRSRATARAAVRAIGGGKPTAVGSTVAAAVDVFGADVLLIALPDRAIEGVANKLADVAANLGAGRKNAGVDLLVRSSAVAAGLSRQGGRQNAGVKRQSGGVKPPLQNKIVLHTSGSLSHTVLAPLRRCGAAVAAMHPMQTFGRGAQTRLNGVVFGLDGDARAVRVARQMVRSLGGIPVRVRPQRKVTYHLSGVFTAPHLLTVLEAGVRILVHSGLTRRQAMRALFTMARHNIANLERYGARKAWTGPVPRGDYTTVAKHIAVLRSFPPEYRQAYTALTRLAARMMARTPRKMLRELDRVFGKD